MIVAGPYVELRSLAPRVRILSALAGLTLAATAASAGKDVGPASRCDALAKGTAAWNNCVSAAGSEISSDDLFYAGYWLARLGRYGEAIAYLDRVVEPDARALTYLGFAKRKSGDVAAAFPHYRKALELDPGFVVARAYLGEALLTTGDVAGARRELEEIARRCGTTCAAYDELARHVARFEGARG